MSVRFLHTSDWQIGKVFRFVDANTMAFLQEARLQAITRIGELAGKYEAKHVLVAGDIYDKEALSPLSLNQPIERMRSFSNVQWHLLPGNHDHHRPNGLWSQLLRKGLPDNVHIHVSAEPAALEDDVAVLLPAPLHHRRTLDDPTAYMNGVDLPNRLIRVGVAHGTVTGFGSDDRDTPNYIAPNRPTQAELSYLALGDWHGQKRINDRCWYSGTPEIDAFDVENGGQVLLVEIEGHGVVPTVTPLRTGYYDWITRSATVNNRGDIDLLEKTLRNVEDPLRTLVHLSVEGTLSLEDDLFLRERIMEGVSAAFRFMRVDDRQLFHRPTDEDLDRIDRGGFVRKAAEELKRQAQEGTEDERNLATEALLRLYVEHMKLEADHR